MSTLKQDVENLENVIFVCFGQPSDDDLPQVANDHEMVIDVVHEYTGRPFHEIEAEFYNQTESWH